jgi:hypothetical protein
MNEIDDIELARRLRADIERTVGDAGNGLRPPAPDPSFSGADHPARRRWLAWSAAAATITLLVGGLVMIANRGTDDDADADVPPVTTATPADTVPGSTVPLSTVPLSTVPGVAPVLQYETILAVIDDGGGAQLCFSVLESLPPQCGGGLALLDWSWDAITVEQTQGGVSWVDSIYVRGVLDGESFRVVEARIPTDEERDRLTGGPALDFSVPCPEPEGGWPARKQEFPEEVAGLEGYAGAWFDESQQVMTFKFTGDLAVAEQAVRQFYSGAVCVVPAEHTQQELLSIQNQLASISSVMITTAVYVDATGEWVQADVFVPDPERQAAFDAEYGPGVVRIESPLKPVGTPAAPSGTTPPVSTVPATTPAAQTVEGVASVLESSTHAPQLCVNGLLDSYPQQCAGGPDLVGFSWDSIEDEEVQNGTTTVGTVYIKGEYDASANTITVIEQRPPNDDDAARFAAAFAVADYSTPCEPPANGWPARNQEWPIEEVSRIDGYAGSWTAAGEQVVVAKFTGDLAAAEAAIGAFYGDAVCIVPATHSLVELVRVREEVMLITSVEWNTVDVIVDSTGEWIDVVTTAPQPGLQEELDAQFGRGLVRLHSLLLPVG